ncbi:MAG: hypothetical protein Q9218_003422, partial [Villophora microphyllina]
MTGQGLTALLPLAGSDGASIVNNDDLSASTQSSRANPGGYALFSNKKDTQSSSSGVNTGNATVSRMTTTGNSTGFASPSGVAALPSGTGFHIGSKSKSVSESKPESSSGDVSPTTDTLGGGGAIASSSDGLAPRDQSLAT